jgi:hypothetical protein
VERSELTDSTTLRRGFLESALRPAWDRTLTGGNSPPRAELVEKDGNAFEMPASSDDRIGLTFLNRYRILTVS